MDIGYYRSVGLDPIPLRTNSKAPQLNGWQSTPVESQWSIAYPGNLGIRCGGPKNVGVIDSDDDACPTWPKVKAHLDGLGITDYPLVATPHGGRHAYLLVDGQMQGSTCLLNRQVGAGEFRYGSGAYVVAPPSQINDTKYELVCGTFSYIPQVKRDDLLPILSYKWADTSPATDHKTAVTRYIPAKARRILNGDWSGYQSRSEADYAVILTLVEHDFTANEIFYLFQTYGGAGKVKDEGRRWFDQAYQQAVDYSLEHELQDRTTVRYLMQRADSEAWPGRTGATDHSVYGASLKIAYRAASLKFYAGIRLLSELSGVGDKTTYKSVKRLISRGKLVKAESGEDGKANFYRVVEPTEPSSGPLAGEFQETASLLPHILAVRLCGHEDAVCEKVDISHDLFANKLGLGKVAGEVYACLVGSEPLSVPALTERTGRSRRAVERALSRMRDLFVTNLTTGELLPMVVQDGRLWSANYGDLDRAAAHVGSLGRGEQRKAAHAKERAAYWERKRSAHKVAQGLDNVPDDQEPDSP